MSITLDQLKTFSSSSPDKSARSKKRKSAGRMTKIQSADLTERVYKVVARSRGEVTCNSVWKKLDDKDVTRGQVSSALVKLQASGDVWTKGRFSGRSYLKAS